MGSLISNIRIVNFLVRYRHDVSNVVVERRDDRRNEGRSSAREW